MIFYILFYGFLAYLFFRLVFNFILPIYRTTKQVRKGFKDMQEKMRQQPDPYANQQPSSATKNSSGKVGDYIDFEEIKE